MLQLSVTLGEVRNAAEDVYRRMRQENDEEYKFTVTDCGTFARTFIARLTARADGINQKQRTDIIKVLERDGVILPGSSGRGEASSRNNPQSGESTDKVARSGFAVAAWTSAATAWIGSFF